MNNIKYSIIIITYNEEDNILDCIKSIRKNRNDIEIIVVDGGSNDRTIEIVNNTNCKVIISEPGRGIQFNAGVKQAEEDIFLFLHGDTKLPNYSFLLLDKFFENPDNKIGTFQLGFDKENLMLKIYSFFTRFDSIFTKFGDQCIVVRKSFYEEIGGFPNWPLFEDVEFLKKARSKTKLHTFNLKVKTSARRFFDKGLIKLQLVNGWYLVQFFFGVKPEVLAKKYNLLRKEDLNDKQTKTEITNNNQKKKLKRKKQKSLIKILTLFIAVSINIISTHQITQM